MYFDGIFIGFGAGVDEEHAVERTAGEFRESSGSAHSNVHRHGITLEITSLGLLRERARPARMFVAECGDRMTTVNPSARDAVGEYKWGFHDEEQPLFIAEKGLNEDVIRGMSAMKGEPAWMLENRLDAYRTFLELKDPAWAGSPELLQAIDFDDMVWFPARFGIAPRSHDFVVVDDKDVECHTSSSRRGIPPVHQS